MLLVLSGMSADTYAEDAKNKGSNLTVPWDEFKKLLHLDENEIVISLETFQKLLAQTGPKPLTAKWELLSQPVRKIRLTFILLLEDRKHIPLGNNAYKFFRLSIVNHRQDVHLCLLKHIQYLI